MSFRLEGPTTKFCAATLDDGSTKTLGRLDVGLEFTYVSQKHALIRCTSGGLTVECVSTNNPTCVESAGVWTSIKRGEPAVSLQAGDRVALDRFQKERSAFVVVAAEPPIAEVVALCVFERSLV